MKLKSKTVLLTGATGGIGQELARQLDQKGARLLLSATNREALKALTHDLQGKSHQIIAARLTDKSERGNLIELARHAKVDVLINLAGLNHFGLLEQTEEQQLQDMLELNLLAPMLLSKAFAPILSERSEAAIINVGSILGSIGYAGSTGYCASKFGLRGFTESLRRELAQSPVKVVYLAPRATKTAMNSHTMTQMNQALKVAMDPADMVARDIINAIEHDEAQRYFGWPEKFFVRLNALFPALVDNALLKQLPIIQHHARLP